MRHLALRNLMIVTGLNVTSAATVTEIVTVAEIVTATESDEIGAEINIEERSMEIKS
jgi:hypothetical protein